MAITDIKSALPTPYASLAEADLYLNSTELWFEQDSEIKNEALGWARVYLDANYTFFNLDEDDPSNAIKQANILLANAHLTESLFTRQVKSDPLEEVEVKAGSVSTRKRYSARTNWFDPFPEVTQILSGAGEARISARASDVPVARA